MIDIPLGKALVPVKSNPDDFCDNCDLLTTDLRNFAGCYMKCGNDERKDGEKIIYKLVDYPVEVKK